MKKQTKYKKLLLAKYIETQVMVRGGDISYLMGKPLSYFDYDRIAASIISLLSDTDWNADGLSATERADILDMAFMCSYKVDKEMLKTLTA
tara:strand:- start:222 stop:494 length:273 start_codon:yes stop_codon:yes gene_type:complete